METFGATPPVDELFGLMTSTGVERCMLFADDSSGLQAVLVLDDLTLGPAAGGIRTASYGSFADALADARKLASAMTQKCALADLGAGGAAVVVLDHPGLVRGSAFEVLGAHIETLEGMVRLAGDYGTGREDLRAVARMTRYVQSDEERLAVAAALGVTRCIEAIQEFWGQSSGLESLQVAIQGCGAVGSALATVLSNQGAQLWVSDLVESRAARVHEETGAHIAPPDELIQRQVDVLCPCATGNWLDTGTAEQIQARAICGAAHNVLTGVEAARALKSRDIVFLPDSITSAGAVIEGIGRALMGLPDRTPLIDHLGRTALKVLHEANSKDITPFEAATELAHERLRAADG